MAHVHNNVRVTVPPSPMACSTCTCHVVPHQELALRLQGTMRTRDSKLTGNINHNSLRLFFLFQVRETARQLRVSSYFKFSRGNNFNNCGFLSYLRFASEEPNTPDGGLGCTVLRQEMAKQPTSIPNNKILQQAAKRPRRGLQTSNSKANQRTGVSMVCIYSAGHRQGPPAGLNGPPLKKSDTTHTPHTAHTAYIHTHMCNTHMYAYMRIELAIVFPLPRGFYSRFSVKQTRGKEQQCKNKAF